MTDASRSRRRLLVGLAGGLGIGLSTGRLIPEQGSTRIATAGEGPETVASEEPLSEAETPYAVFQYRPLLLRDDFEPTLPINVVFPLENATFEDVVDVFREAGWYPRPAEYVRYAYDRGADRWQRSHWSGGETAFGVVGRLHVRCWRLDGTASIQVHVDTPATPYHRVRSHADGARALAELFGAAGWRIDPDDPETIDLGNASAPDHDGRAVVIRG